MSKINHNRTFGNLILYVSVGLFSCNTPNRAAKLFDKSARISEKTVAEKCAAKFPNKDSINERTVYVQGEETVLHDTVTYSDTVNHTIYKYITKTVSKTDTLYKDKTTTITNTAAIKALELQHIDDVKVISAKQDRLYICYWVLIVLGVYTLGRWVLRIWNIKLP